MRYLLALVVVTTLAAAPADAGVLRGAAHLVRHPPHALADAAKAVGHAVRAMGHAIVKVVY